MRRDFTHIDDIVRGVLAALESAPAGFRAYNLGSGAPVDLRTLVDAIALASGARPTIVHGPMQLGDVDATFADIARARSELGWQPRIALPDGLRSVVEWVQAHP
jgi:UDP-glucuronate 4-epimerase